MVIKDNQQMLRLAANLLTSNPLGGRAEPAASALLQALGYDRPAPTTSSPPLAATAHRARLLRAAATFPRLFQLDCETAPGLVFFGAELATPTPLSASGAGLTFRSAFEGCVGEGIELSSQFPGVGAELIHTETCSGIRWDPSRFHPGLPADRDTDWLQARRLIDGSPVCVPTDMVLRRGDRCKLSAPYPLSLGCGAGPSLAQATLHGLLELIERDAAALWWRGGRRPRLLPLDSPVSAGAARILATIRQGSCRRRAWLLDITTDLGVPCVASVSVDPDGFSFACGVAAGMSMWDASQAAIREMCQMELAREVVAAKRRERGEAGLNAFDTAHEQRARALDAGRCLLLHPLPPVDPVPDSDAVIEPEATPDEGPDAADPARSVRHLVQRLESRGIELAMIDLTRPDFGVPVVRVLCPGLEKEPSTQMGPRLLAAIAETGGGAVHTHDVPLM